MSERPTLSWEFVSNRGSSAQYTSALTAMLLAIVSNYYTNISFLFPLDFYLFYHQKHSHSFQKTPLKHFNLVSPWTYTAQLILIVVVKENMKKISVKKLRISVEYSLVPNRRPPLINFLIFSTQDILIPTPWLFHPTHLLCFGDFSNPPAYSNPPSIRHQRVVHVRHHNMEILNYTQTVN